MSAHTFGEGKTGLTVDYCRMWKWTLSLKPAKLFAKENDGLKRKVVSFSRAKTPVRQRPHLIYERAWFLYVIDRICSQC